MPCALVRTNEWGQADIARLLDTYVFWDSTSTGLGQVVCELGNAYLHAGGGRAANTNGTAIFSMLVFPGKSTPTLDNSLTLPGLHAAAKHMKKQIGLLNAAVSLGTLRPETEAAVRDLRTVADLSVLACHLGQSLIKHGCGVAELPNTQRTDLANRLIQLVERIETDWKVRNRKGGLDASLEFLRSTVRTLLGSAPTATH